MLNHIPIGTNKKEYIKNLKKYLELSLPCEHIGCYNHISHPCTWCGRLQGILPEEEKIRVRELIEYLEFPEEVKYTKFTRFEIMDI